VKNPLDVKENDEHALAFAPHLSRLFQSWLVWTFRAWLTLSSLNACKIIARVCVTIFPRFAQNLMLFVCRTHRKIAIRPDKDSK
jgi:hypothetical protein